uniref:Myb-like domain-containing protein n=1 Tax=Chromera velia CCMP2878 TaxID=1169474 RepID=A0A0G4HJ45_9ALVE|eukprot:Cvel_7076.t1-p1 / transcript=Cvel_7076.t1 / gene=Cvel_7076 / organism=Chromera_velia_CCMP2878 / gene_product=hypothetical protein / transcript_product=hypothetical protein / location=Cvel_scaffold362:8359-15725(+) / protein_length=908 / sequence_SO=supercontig / SO=protein_coding / is_pseudo=false
MAEVAFAFSLGMHEYLKNNFVEDPEEAEGGEADLGELYQEWTSAHCEWASKLAFGEIPQTGAMASAVLSCPANKLRLRMIKVLASLDCKRWMEGPDAEVCFCEIYELAQEQAVNPRELMPRLKKAKEQYKLISFLAETLGDPDFPNLDAEPPSLFDTYMGPPPASQSSSSSSAAGGGGRGGGAEDAAGGRRARFWFSEKDDGEERRRLRDLALFLISTAQNAPAAQPVGEPEAPPAEAWGERFRKWVAAIHTKLEEASESGAVSGGLSLFGDALEGGQKKKLASDWADDLALRKDLGRIFQGIEEKLPAPSLSIFAGRRKRSLGFPGSLPASQGPRGAAPPGAPEGQEASQMAAGEGGEGAAQQQQPQLGPQARLRRRNGRPPRQDHAGPARIQRTSPRLAGQERPNYAKESEEDDESVQEVGVGGPPVGAGEQVRQQQPPGLRGRGRGRGQGMGRGGGRGRGGAPRVGLSGDRERVDIREELERAAVDRENDEAEREREDEWKELQEAQRASDARLRGSSGEGDREGGRLPSHSALSNGRRRNPNEEDEDVRLAPEDSRGWTEKKKLSDRPLPGTFGDLERLKRNKDRVKKSRNWQFWESSSGVPPLGPWGGVQGEGGPGGGAFSSSSSSSSSSASASASAAAAAQPSESNRMSEEPSPLEWEPPYQSTIFATMAFGKETGILDRKDRLKGKHPVREPQRSPQYPGRPAARAITMGGKESERDPLRDAFRDALRGGGLAPSASAIVGISGAAAASGRGRDGSAGGGGALLDSNGGGLLSGARREDDRGREGEGEGQRGGERRRALPPSVLVGPAPKKPRVAWTQEEEKLFLTCINSHGAGNWESLVKYRIPTDPRLTALRRFNATQLREKWRNMEPYIKPDTSAAGVTLWVMRPENEQPVKRRVKKE